MQAVLLLIFIKLKDWGKFGRTIKLLLRRLRGRECPEAGLGRSCLVALCRKTQTEKETVSLNTNIWFNNNPKNISLINKYLRRSPKWVTVFEILHLTTTCRHFSDLFLVFPNLCSCCQVNFQFTQKSPVSYGGTLGENDVISSKL